MVLRVSSDRFAVEVKQRLGKAEVYLNPKGRRTVATAGIPESQLVIAAEFHAEIEQTRAELAGQGVTAHEGLWCETLDEMEVSDISVFTIAVSYRSEGAKPGLWMDADLHEISTGEVLKRMYDEFRANGEIKESSFDEFVKVIEPNVLVVAPHQLAAWADENRNRQNPS